MGFDGFFFARIDYDDKKHRLIDKRMELVWRGSQTLGQATEIFTSVLYDGYGPPRGFCFDRGCDDPPVMVSCMHMYITIYDDIACRYTYVYALTCTCVHVDTHIYVNSIYVCTR